MAYKRTKLPTGKSFGRFTYARASAVLVMHRWFLLY